MQVNIITLYIFACATQIRLGGSEYLVQMKDGGMNTQTSPASPGYVLGMSICVRGEEIEMHMHAADEARGNDGAQLQLKGRR